MVQGAYVFGYGSLIEKESRTRTNPEAADARPARVTDYQRGWFHQFANNVGSTCTFLGAIEKPGATTNGVFTTSTTSRKPNSGKPAMPRHVCLPARLRCWMEPAPGTLPKLSTSS